MKKSIIATILFGFFMLFNLNLNAQTFQEGDAVINGGIGLGTTYTWAGGLGIPLGAGFEYGVTDLETGSIGVGGDIGYVSGGSLSILYIGGKGSYHFNDLLEVENENLDLYGGLGIYYRNFSFSGTGSTFASGLVASFHVGTRYYFTDNFGGYAELGNNWAWLNLGVTYKF